MTENDPAPPPQHAVWFFIGATFVFAAPVILLPGRADPWLTIGCLTAGVVLMVLGGIRLRREIRARRPRPPGER